jgi:hypothetical protein
LPINYTITELYTPETLKMEAAISSEMSVSTYMTARSQNPKDHHMNKYRWESQKERDH